jgi:hypothetical protein
MRTTLWGAVLVHLCAGVAQAQTFDHLQIQLAPYIARTAGGEKPIGGWYSSGPVAIGKAVTTTISVGESCEAFAISSGSSLATNATAAWKFEITPTRVVRDEVAFRLRWWGASLPGSSGRLVFNEIDPAPRQVDLTMRPGESWPVFTLPRVSGYSCAIPTSIRVSVDNYPLELEERRLVSADLWLVERLADGSEVQRGQPLAVRGMPYRPLSFYFDSLTAGSASLDVYGDLAARPERGEMAVSLETRVRWPRKSGSAFVGPQRSVKSEIQVKPDETVEIRLPVLTDDAGAFAKRSFSIRIRARQLR